jgi:hypothetical protein
MATEMQAVNLRPSRRWPIVGALLGGAAGLAYWYFLGCEAGCPGQENPLLTVGLGTSLGLVLGVSLGAR